MIHMDIDAIRREPLLSYEKANSLILPVTESEVWQALKGIGDCKAPGVDGYNASFFKQSWMIIKMMFSGLCMFSSTTRSFMLKPNVPWSLLYLNLRKLK